MNELMSFNYESAPMRTIQIDGEPWFVGKDVATILGYSNTGKAILKHVCEEDRQILSSQNGNFENIPNRGLTIINESGLYSLILSSKLEGAKAFKHWVTSEVLPSIRKTGMYMPEDILQNPDFIIQLGMQLKEKQQRVLELEQQAEAAKPTIQFCNEVLNDKDLFTTTEVAQDFGMNAQQLNKMLANDFKVIYKRSTVRKNEPWKLYSEYVKMGYGKNTTYKIMGAGGKPAGFSYSLKWTQKGRKWI